MALRSVPGMIWGLVVQRGPWKETKKDLTEAAATAGKPHAGHNAEQTIRPTPQSGFMPSMPNPSKYAQRSVVKGRAGYTGGASVYTDYVAYAQHLENVIQSVDRMENMGFAKPADYVIKQEAKNELENVKQESREHDRMPGAFTPQIDISDYVFPDIPHGVPSTPDDVYRDRGRLTFDAPNVPFEDPANFYQHPGIQPEVVKANQNLSIVDNTPVFIAPTPETQTEKASQDIVHRHSAFTEQNFNNMSGTKRKASQDPGPSTKFKPNPKPNITKGKRIAMDTLPEIKPVLKTNVPMTSTTSKASINVKLPKYPNPIVRTPANPRISEESDSKKRKATTQRAASTKFRKVPKGGDLQINTTNLAPSKGSNIKQANGEAKSAPKKADKLPSPRAKRAKK